MVKSKSLIHTVGIKKKLRSGIESLVMRSLVTIVFSKSIILDLTQKGALVVP